MYRSPPPTIRAAKILDTVIMMRVITTYVPISFSGKFVNRLMPPKALLGDTPLLDAAPAEADCSANFVIIVCT